MIIYEMVKRFHPVTGEKVDQKIQKEIRCDYTGLVADENDCIYCSYNFNYNDHDQCFGSSGIEYQLGKDFDIDVYNLLSKEYHFYNDPMNFNPIDNAESHMMKTALSKFSDKDSPWYNCTTFESMCRVARCLTVRKLIEDKVLTPDQFNGDW